MPEAFPAAAPPGTISQGSPERDETSAGGWDRGARPPHASAHASASASANANAAGTEENAIPNRIVHLASGWWCGL